MPPARRPLAALAALALGAAGIATCEPPGWLRGPNSAGVPLELPAIAPLDRRVRFDPDVRPVLENRCVVCHGCYDAPCQLLLSSPAGIERGASQQAVYDAARLRSMHPTRLGIDARTPEQWREREFFSVLGATTGGDGAAGDALLLQMLALGAARPFPPGERLPDSVELDIGRELHCARTPAEFSHYVEEHPQGGMPYAMAPLSSNELRTLASWVMRGAPLPEPAPAPGARARQRVAQWEAFLNGESLRERIVARYLYEHWFVAHLAFDDVPGSFWRVVRSRTPSGQPIDEIASVRPFDDPGGPVHYRLQLIHETIVHKTHIVYGLSAARMARLRELFLGTDWQPTRFPSYAPETASNPFLAFAEMPARSRYQYLLDDAGYFVMTFIRGPVCRGQVAVDVIEDQFWIAFLDPDHDFTVTRRDFLAENAGLLSLPAEHGGHLLPGELWLEYNVKQHRYLEERERVYDEIDPERRGPALDWLWDGDGHNSNALLTVFRNFDNATVVHGFVGGIPKTAWVLDYPILERIYYDLVAGYDVFGTVGHQVATRLYMDHLRMQSENLFLAFLPAETREEIRASWYVGATRQVEYFLSDKLRTLGHGTQLRFSGADPKAEMLEQILARSAAIAGPPDTLNRCAEPPCDRAEATLVERAAERELQKLASVRGAWVAQLPELTLLRVRVDGAGQRDLVYGLVRNVAHTNVALMFGEDKRLLPEQDTLSVVRGHFGSYPNFFFEVEAARVAEFVAALTAATSPAQFERVVERYGLRRTDPRIWATSDWLRKDLERRDPAQAGLYDLGRYANP